MFEDSTFGGNRLILRNPEEAHYQLMQQISDEANSENPDEERIKLLKKTR